MNNLTINIGLNVNNNEPKEQLLFTFINLDKLFNGKEYQYKILEGGQWNNNKERVVIVELNAGSLNLFSIKLLLSWLCTELNQDAISFKLNNEGHIVFDPLYMGKIFKFSEEKFINF